MQDQDKSLLRENEELKKKIEEIIKGFSHTTTYRAMQKEIAFYKDLAEANLRDAEDYTAEAERLKAEQKQTGLPEKSDQEQEILRLKAQLKGRERTIRTLENTISRLIYQNAEEAPSLTNPAEDIPVPQAGRPVEITNAEKQLMVRYREDGYSLREIARITGFSIGSVHAVTCEVKMHPEKVKEHREKRKNEEKS